MPDYVVVLIRRTRDECLVVGARDEEEAKAMAIRGEIEDCDPLPLDVDAIISVREVKDDR